jgi:PAS domain S-box-containing protein
MALLSMVATPLSHQFPFSLFFVAAALSTWFGGPRQGILAVMLAPFPVHYLVMPLSTEPRELLRVGLWLLIAGAIVVMVGKLRGFQGRAKTVLANIDEGVVILDRAWNILYVNECGAHFAGCSPREMIGRHYWEVVPQSRDTVEQHLRECAEENVPVQFEARMHGQQRTFHVRAYPVPEGICFFSQDISEAKQRESKLRAILDHLAAAHRAARIGTWEWNLRTNETFWSEEIPPIHAIPTEQFDGKLTTWIKTVHPEDAAGVRAKLRDALKNKDEYYTEFRVVRPSGEIRWVCSHARVILDQQGNAERMVGATTDFTQRRLEEEALRRSEKLAAAGRLAATIAHEINNPLAAITNLVYLMRMDPGIKPDTQEMLLLADEQLARVNHIAKQTLGFYQDRSVPEAIDVVQTLEGLLSILQSRINAKHLRVEREWESTCMLTGFRGEVRQVLSNLLTNAIDASLAGGRLIVRIRPQRSGNDVKAIHIEIEDFGSGIQPQDQARIFEPFFTTKSDVGTGLGLWVTKSLVEKNGGAISFRSNCHDGIHGTCFSVVLPASMNAMEGAADTQPAA